MRYAHGWHLERCRVSGVRFQGWYRDQAAPDAADT